MTIVQSSGSPLNALIRDVLVEGRSGEGPGAGRESYESGGWKMEWTLANGLELIFVVSASFLV
jgi:signal recognition particle receptor subunit alpha